MAVVAAKARSRVALCRAGQRRFPRTPAAALHVSFRSTVQKPKHLQVSMAWTVDADANLSDPYAQRFCDRASFKGVAISRDFYFVVVMAFGHSVYLVAFGPSHHRAWIVGQRLLGCLLVSLQKPLGNLLEAV